jgi:hypothetical protein
LTFGQEASGAARLKIASARWPNDYSAQDRLPTDFFQRFCGVHGRPGGAAKKFHFFCCLGDQVFRKIAGNKVWTALGPDITPGGAVQNILKKMKKRLVSPIKSR